MTTSIEKLRWARVCEWASYDITTCADVIALKDIVAWFMMWQEEREANR